MSARLLPPNRMGRTRTADMMPIAVAMKSALRTIALRAEIRWTERARRSDDHAGRDYALRQARSFRRMCGL